MVLTGILLTLAGFVLNLLSLALDTTPAVRLGIVSAGIALSLAGIMGVLNRYYVSKALWRR